MQWRGGWGGKPVFLRIITSKLKNTDKYANVRGFAPPPPPPPATSPLAVCIDRQPLFSNEIYVTYLLSMRSNYSPHHDLPTLIYHKFQKKLLINFECWWPQFVILPPGRIEPGRIERNVPILKKNVPTAYPERTGRAVQPWRT